MALIVIDASVLSTALAGNRVHSEWAGALVRDNDIVAPHLLPVETTSVLRGLETNGFLAPHLASRAVDAQGQLAIGFFPFAPYARRVWELRHNLSSYDAWYVAVAEALDVPLATIDGRAARAPGTRCQFLQPT